MFITEEQKIKEKNKIRNEEEKYAPLTYQQILYLRDDGTHNYYFRKLSKELKEAINKLAKDNNFEVLIKDTYEPVTNKNKISKKDGFIVTLIVPCRR